MEAAPTLVGVVPLLLFVRLESASPSLEAPHRTKGKRDPVCVKDGLQIGGNGRCHLPPFRSAEQRPNPALFITL
ncbi:hypothetical protein N658DRAFT_498306 [Parathielavia hyrcaniae]|uniref:Secreted protein n=1 Tax=Parathielavia hyrcaniae TaxID=113614 RepID=A0AAN6PX70_9PEZI|nr:hypothetical protein N658DRAFT_498306 [Parathielavia hyrcaniae]